MKKSIHLKYYLRGLGVGIVVTTLIMGIVTGREKERLSDSEIRERARALGMTEQSTVLADTVKETDGETSSGDRGTDGESGALALPAGSESPSPTPLETMAVPGMEAQPSVSPLVSPSPRVSSPAATSKPSPTPMASPVPSAERETPKPSPAAGISAGGTSVPSAGASAGASAEAEADSSQESAAGGTAPKEAESEQAAGTAEGSVIIDVVTGDGSFSVSRKLEAAGVVASASEFDAYLCQNGYDRSIRTGSYAIPANASQEQIAKILLRME